MTLTQVWGAFLIFVLSPVVGGLPLTGWSTRLLSGKRLRRVGTGNVGVSAAFYHGGKVAGIVAVLLEAAKGIGVVLLARHYFPADPVWEIIALIGLVMGRYWFAKGAGTTNVVWGVAAYDWPTALLTFMLSGLGFTIFRERRQGRLLSLVLLPLITALRHSDGELVLAMSCLSGLIAWIYQKLPDDLDLPDDQGRLESRTMFRFFRGDRALVALDRALDPTKFGHKAATLGQLTAWGYPVPRGYVLPAGDDPTALLAIAEPSPTQPLAVRSSAQDEDTGTASAAGVYQSFLNITSQEALAAAIVRVFSSYSAPQAKAYRQSKGLPEQGLAVIVQQQVQGQFSGVAFSRDPIARCGDAVVIEALPGGADQVVGGQVTPEQYRVLVQADDMPPLAEIAEADWQLSDALTLTVEGQGQTPSRLLQQVAYLARHLESRYQGVPQDLEWSFDGNTLWLLQSRPITTLQPLWTRKIAAEVIPGTIRPLTWSINRPLTCGVWGEIFTVVLGDRARGLDFEATATLHHAHAYFNATLLGDIFRRMGLPAESLEFLTRGAKFSRPPLGSTLRNMPGLVRLLRRELKLEQQFTQENRDRFAPALQALANTPRDTLTPQELLDRVDQILELLKRVTYYNILGPLSFALRRALLKVPEESLNPMQNDEIAALEALRAIAQDIRQTLSKPELARITDSSSLMTALAESTDGESLLKAMGQFIEQYGYLSPVGTDIAVATWQESPGPVRELLAQFVQQPPPPKTTASQGKATTVQRRLDLKGQVNTIYNRLLAELRWSVLALATQWQTQGHLQERDDIFLLTLEEIQALVGGRMPDWRAVQERIGDRKAQYERDKKMPAVPYLVFGNEPPSRQIPLMPTATVQQKLTGIGASAGTVAGPVLVVTQLEAVAAANGPFILVVPYTDAGWAPLLARAHGLIAEVGGRLSHGAIIAREYGIPAVMDVTNATQRLHTGQWVRVNGETGVVEVLEPPANSLALEAGSK
ncbi:glycerol-3-phosphate acyltransferase [Phormidium tenue]|uniref:Pyruvate phosphate dikinase PEP/pyruvate-binding protein n=1 Tax=Phormidium tenue NIES-30 TaxID=549789 RepID=A0A1U7J726_9CYAN|nr:glycerol-3-phosphate acyltransferase [Phormidium tenue]MBD2233608.1 glycerol-3-phosphate acyltransferase [Phormidium tenue FACHB-1052]OKH48707.1 pyruvate phosphate dikinase PEP/pyruvate-binding protein [Phormidium tenue NIES-30]